MNLMLVRKRIEINCRYENETQVETEQQENPVSGIELEETLEEIIQKDEDQELPVQIEAENKELERLFTHKLQYVVCLNVPEL